MIGWATTAFMVGAIMLFVGGLVLSQSAKKTIALRICFAAVVLICVSATYLGFSLKP